MKDLFLAEPSKKYQKSFEDYVMAYKNSDNFYYDKYQKALETFDQYVNELYSYSKGVNVPEDWVAYSTFWLIHEDTVRGVVRVRHQEIEYAGHIGYDISPLYRNKGYGTKILELALKKAAEIGISKAIVTCSVNNIASKKIIEKNNGKFLGEFFDDEENENVYKFEIITADRQ